MTKMYAPLTPTSHLQTRWLQALVRPPSASLGDAERAALLKQTDSWTEILRRIEAEALGPHLARLLARMDDRHLPPEVRAALQASAVRRQARTLLQVEALRRVLSALARAGVVTLHFKGPALACLLTGDAAGREYADLDLLVGRADRKRAGAILSRLGYVADWPIAPGAGSPFRHGCAVALRHPGGVSVDLHWSLATPLFPLRLSWDQLVNRARHVAIANFEASTFGPEDTLHHLCIHAAKDDWAYWSAFADLAGVLESERGLDFDLLRDLATRAGTRRVLRVGLLLATQVAWAPLKTSAYAWAREDPTALEIARAAECRLLAGASVDQSIRARLGRSWRKRERYGERLMSVLGAAVRAAEPRAGERSAWGVLRSPVRLLRDLRSDARPALGGSKDTSRGAPGSES